MEARAELFETEREKHKLRYEKATIKIRGIVCILLHLCKWIWVKLREILCFSLVVCWPSDASNILHSSTLFSLFMTCLLSSQSFSHLENSTELAMFASLVDCTAHLNDVMTLSSAWYNVSESIRNRKQD